MGIVIIFTACLVAIPCALLGSILVLRKMSMLADAISHAVLPGLVIAFLLSGQRTGLFVQSMAVAFGLLCTWLVHLFHTRAKLQSDAAIGVSFTALFALGVILLSAFAGQIDLDVDCVLYGEIAYAPIDLWWMGGYSLGPRQAWSAGLATLTVLGFFTAFYKELQLLAFDERYAKACGLPVARLHLALMILTTVTCVASFESVGAILVLAFLTIPAAAAVLLVKQFRQVLMLASVFGALSAAGGYGLSSLTGGSIAAGMALVATGIFAVALAYTKLGKRSGTLAALAQ